jgi:hypothetical protein
MPIPGVSNFSVAIFCVSVILAFAYIDRRLPADVTPQPIHLPFEGLGQVHQHFQCLRLIETNRLTRRLYDETNLVLGFIGVGRLVVIINLKPFGVRIGVVTGIEADDLVFFLILVSHAESPNTVYVMIGAPTDETICICEIIMRIAAKTTGPCQKFKSACIPSPHLDTGYRLSRLPIFDTCWRRVLSEFGPNPANYKLKGL